MEMNEENLGQQAAPAEKGFTLIELSIVLVIIGLIVGGVLVGQDLIRAAEIRATVGQIEKYNASVNTFRGKYNGIPGDLINTGATAFGLFAETTLGGTAGHMDGNSIIEGGSAGATVGLGETIAFWRHMTDASLIDGSFGSSGNSIIVATTGAVTGTVTNISQSLPPAKLGRNNYVGVFSVNGVNFYEIAPFATLPASGVYTFGAYGMTPIETYNIDVKIDDGMPNTGLVVARGIAAVNSAPTVNAASTAANCTIGTAIATDTYNRVTGTGGTDPSCAMRVRFN